MGSDAKGPRASHGPEMGPAVCGALVEGPDADARGDHGRPGEGDPARSPQGGPISPLITNIFLHYGFDTWMSREYPGVQFERFADDVVVHCVTERQARQVREAIGGRMVDIGLELHPDKTKIVYCKDSNRRREFDLVSFTFCGYTFRPRRSYNKAKKQTFTR